jgi:hypothetical protein
MESSARLYNCACCHQLVVICSECDHGNIYCFDGCSEEQRARSLRAANKTYRNTFKGKRNAARRQAKFRVRAHEGTAEPPPPDNKVTHQGSGADSLPAPMDGDPGEGAIAMNRCHCCGKPVDGYLRLGFVRHRAALLSGSFPFPSG